MRWIALLLLLVVAPLLADETASQVEPANPFAPDGVALEIAPVPSGVPHSQFERDQAVAWLDAYPAAPEAARVAFNVYMQATVDGDAKLATAMWKRLAFANPRCVEHQFLLGMSNSDEYRKMLSAAVNEQAFDLIFAKRFVEAVLADTDRPKSTLLSNDEFLVKVALATGKVDRIERRPSKEVAKPANAHEALELALSIQMLEKNAAARERLLAVCRQKLMESKSDGDAAKAARILFDERLDDVGRVLALHRIEDSGIARLCEGEFYGRLQVADLARAEVQEALAERLLEEGKYDEALPVIEELLSRGPNAKHLYWKGWCLTTLGKPGAAEAFESVGAQFPDDPWRGVADTAASAVRELDRRLAVNAEATAQLFKEFASTTIDAFECRAEITPQAGEAFSVYVSSAAGTKGEILLEAFVLRGETVLLAVRSNESGSRLYVSGDERVHTFVERMPLPAGTFGVNFDAKTKTYGFDFAATLSSSAKLETFRDSIGASFRKLELGSIGGVRKVMENFVAKGTLPAAVEVNERGTTYSALSFDPRRPTLDRSSWRVGGDGRLEEVSSGIVTLRGLRYGSAGAFTPQPPAWPDAPVVAHEKFDVTLLFQIAAKVSELVAGKTPGVVVPAAVER